MRHAEPEFSYKLLLTVISMTLVVIALTAFNGNQPLLLAALAVGLIALAMLTWDFVQLLKEDFNFPFRKVTHFDMASVIPYLDAVAKPPLTLASCGREVAKPEAAADLKQVTCRPCRRIGFHQIQVSRKYGHYPPENDQ